MAGPSPLKTLHSLHSFSMKKSPSFSFSSSLSLMKLKTLVHTLIYSHICRVARALSKVKSILIEILKEIEIHHILFPTPKKNKSKSTKVFGSFRLHYNWCSSHVLPVPSSILDGCSKSHMYYDSTWNSIISTRFDDHLPESELSGYLHWLEEKASDSPPPTKEDTNEIDRLADMFIANSHEKFRLEKVESYRRFQEMMARSV